MKKLPMLVPHDIPIAPIFRSADWQPQPQEMDQREHTAAVWGPVYAYAKVAA
jgi:hypothetical protein